MKILAIDFDSLFRRNWEAEAGQDGGNAYRRTVEEIQRRRDGWDRVVLAADSGPSFRKAKATDYKEGRTNPGAAYFDQRRRTLARLAADACIVIDGPAVEGGHAEADDVLGWLAAAYTTHTRALDADAAQAWYLRIISGDGDLEQLVSDPDGIDLLKLTEREPWKAADVLGARGVNPDKVPQLKALCGDKSDNYPGFEGIGPKIANVLREAGYATFDSVAASNEADLRRTLADAGLRLAPTLATWPAQSRPSSPRARWRRWCRGWRRRRWSSRRPRRRRAARCRCDRAGAPPAARSRAR